MLGPAVPPPDLDQTKAVEKNSGSGITADLPRKQLVESDPS